MFLTACNPKWKVDVNLTPADKIKVEKDIKEAMAVIKTEQKNKTKGSAMAYVVLARAYEKQGDRKKAAKVYTDAIKYGLVSRAIYNNLGKMYERVGEYKLAIKQYDLLLEKFNEKKYYYDIALAYIELKDGDNASKYYDMWKRKFNTSDIVVEKKIRALRGV